MVANTLYRNKSGGRENCWEVIVPGAARTGQDDECLHRYGFRGGGKKRLDAGYVLRVNPRGFVDKLDAQRQKTKAVKQDSNLES